MKTAAPIPDDVLEETELPSNRVLDEVEKDMDEFSRKASQQVLERVEW